MIIKFIGYDSEIDFNNSNAYTLEVHNKDLFLKVCYDLYNLCYSNHEINNYILLINDEIEKFSKHTIFVDSIFDFDINSKKYINRLYNHVEKMFNLNIEIKREFELNIANINSVVQDLLNDLDIEVTLND